VRGGPGPRGARCHPNRAGCSVGVWPAGPPGSFDQVLFRAMRETVPNGLRKEPAKLRRAKNGSLSRFVYAVRVEPDLRGSAAGRAAGRPLQPVVRPQSGLASDHISAAMTFLRVAKLGRNIGQPDHSLVNPITSYKAERRPGSSEIWLAVTKDDGMQVDSIFIDQAKFC
jgi:hypothetical protein